MRNSPTPTRTKKPLRFSEYAQDFWNYETSLRIQSKKARGRPLSRSYCDLMARLSRVHLVPTFGERLLTAITVREIEQWVLMLRETLAPATVNHALSCLKIMLKEAARQGLILSDPAAKVEELRDECKEKGIFTADEVRTLF